MYGGKVCNVPNELGKELTPSVVWLSEGEHVIGDSAKDYLTVDPENTVYGKRL